MIGLKRWFKERYLPHFWRDFTALGGALFYLLIMLLALVLRSMDLFWTLLFGFVFTTIIVCLVRTFYYRDRPVKVPYRNFMERIDASSFPSLHTGRGVFLMLVLASFFHSLWGAVFLMVLAGFIAYSRLYLQKHDLVDVFFGIVLGALTFMISWLV